MNKYTPGPWTVRTEMNSNQPIYWIWEEDRGEEIANARLIAAAPDLLEAVKTALATHDFAGGPCEILLKKAMAKAEGRE